MEREGRKKEDRVREGRREKTSISNRSFAAKRAMERERYVERERGRRERERERREREKEAIFIPIVDEKIDSFMKSIYVSTYIEVILQHNLSSY